MFVAVGHTSPDTQNIEAVTGLILTSVDGFSWKRAGTGLPGSLSSVAYGNGIFAAVGVGGRIELSTDGGNTWNNLRPSANLLYGITFAADKFVAVGACPSTGQPGWLNYFIMTSLNGQDWVAENLGVLPEGSGLLSSIAFGKDTLVAVGSRAVLTSMNGGDWVVRDAGVYGLYSVTYGNEIFVAVGRSGKIVTSSDGATWVEQNSGFAGLLSGVTYGKQGFMVVALSASVVLQHDNNYSLSLSADQTSTGTGTLIGAGTYKAGLNALVIALPDGNSAFMSWEGDCAGFGAATSGTMTIDGPKSCTAIFGLDPAVDYPVKKGPAAYIRLQAAFDDATAENELVMHMSGVYKEQAVYRGVKAITLKGGYDRGFIDNAGSYTILDGNLQVQGGALTIDNLVIR